MTTQTIPVVNLADFSGGSVHRRQQFVTEVGKALEEIGFLAVVNHGVEADLIQRAYRVSEQFFSLPEMVKRHYEDPYLNGQRGFTSFGREHAKDSTVPDLKEFWHVGREVRSDRAPTSRYPANLSPVEVPQFYPTMTRLYQQLEACAIALLQACALYLGEPETFLSTMVEDGDTILRIIHYPPIPANVHPGSLRSAPHEDINLITLLCEATDDGLELLQRDGTWLPVRAVAGQIIVDSGDMLQQLTNGLMRSTTHRVVNSGNTNPADSGTQNPNPRFSMPFFVHPRPEIDLTPLPQCVERVGERRFPSITAGDYLLQRLREIGLAV
jgi:isopenicillin N synthase-like dioxygenase